MEDTNLWHSVGKRKRAVARIWAKKGSGKITVNKREFNDYFPTEIGRMIILQPFELTNNLDKFDLKVTVRGGGVAGQAGAVKHGITKVLLEIDPELRNKLKKAGFITRDPRIIERKKYGRKKARKSFQYSKR